MVRLFVLNHVWHSPVPASLARGGEREDEVENESVRAPGNLRLRARKQDSLRIRRVGSAPLVVNTRHAELMVSR